MSEFQEALNMLQEAYDQGIISDGYKGQVAVLIVNTERQAVTCGWVTDEYMSHTETPEFALRRIWDRYVRAISRKEADRIDQERT